VVADPNSVTPDIEISIKQHGPRNIDLVIAHHGAIKGGEVGIAYDPAVVIPLAAKAGPDLPAGSEVQFQADPQINCDPETGVAAGFTVGWLNPVNPQVVTPPGLHRLVTIAFGLAEGAAIDSCSALKFVRCLGVKEAPVKNIVTDADGKSQPASTVDGQVCVGGESFRRGDVNGDGSFDISDPIGLLTCLFVNTGDCPECPDLLDANDDGQVNLTDPIYLLTWRFGDGAPPPPPFPDCGTDLTPDSLDQCVPACQ
jgi:hypothetical protein